jgi:hypothetical protein
MFSQDTIEVSENSRLQTEIIGLLQKEDCLGSLNYYNQRFYGMLIMDNKSYEKLSNFFDESWNRISIRKTPLEKRDTEMN